MNNDVIRRLALEMLISSRSRRDAYDKKSKSSVPGNVQKLFPMQDVVRRQEEACVGDQSSEHLLLPGACNRDEQVGSGCSSLASILKKNKLLWFGQRANILFIWIYW